MKRVAQIDRNGATVAVLIVWPSLRAAADSIPDANSANLVACCRGRARSAYGYQWHYVRIVPESGTGKVSYETIRSH